MKYRTLGKSNLRVSVIGIGTWQFGGEWAKDFSQADATAILARGRELGLNLIDTAECYGDHLSESLIGQAIASGAAGRREDWVIATKFGHTFHGFMNRTDDRSAADVAKQLEGSLKALRTDYIDLYQYHSVRDGEFDDADVRAVLDKAERDGKVRHIGNSVSANSTSGGGGNYQVDRSAEAHVEAIQLVYNRLDRKPEEAVLPSCQRQNLGVLARVPLASGFLSGRYKPGATFPAGDVRSSQDPAKVQGRLREVERIGKEEVPPGVPMARWALAWCLKNPVVTCVIPGCKDVRQVEENARAAELVA
jgi:aryl-alcohol dehydrogenase-like predicted oxidoreductase